MYLLYSGGSTFSFVGMDLFSEKSDQIVFSENYLYEPWYVFFWLFNDPVYVLNKGSADIVLACDFVFEKVFRMRVDSIPFIF